MAEIDIKNARVYVRDGKSVQMGATSLVAAEVLAGVSVITFDAGSVAAEGLKVGMWLALGSTLRPRYFITGITGEAVTLHMPLLATVAADARLYRSDWNELEVQLGEGNLTYSIKTPREYKKSRGRLDRVKNADEEPLEVSIDGIWEYFQSNTGQTVTINEALLRIYQAAAWVSAGEECQPYSVDLVVDYKPDCANLTKPNELLIFPDFRCDNLDGDLSGGSLSIPGNCLALLPVAIRYT
jgi:hypothetical protein